MCFQYLELFREVPRTVLAERDFKLFSFVIRIAMRGQLGLGLVLEERILREKKCA